ncbi:HD domain-containing phosphohydrolase [Peribacillus sp. NPDC097675]|uniref:HD domain-containing phosphohydrolase n=1 Tax=Peribacillus sp. NPDC097675 TaxID=3390618 RepID=UPI003D0268DB
MKLFQEFQNRIFINYISGNIIVIFGIGSFLIFDSINISLTDGILTIGTGALSIIIMVCSEYFVYRKDVRPIRVAFEQDAPSLHTLQTAYTAAQRYPLLASRRTLFVHYFGAVIPALSISIFFILSDLLSSEFWVILGLLAGILMSAMHALFDFFLSIKAIHPLKNSLMNQAIALYGKSGTLKSHVFIGIQAKLLVCCLFLTLFPFLLFSILITLNLGEKAFAFWSEFSVTSSLFFLFIILIAFAGVYLLTKDIQAPIQTLKTGITSFTKGEHKSLDNTYTDEFHDLINGFNHLMTSVENRDEQKQNLLNNTYSIIAAMMDVRDSYTAGHSIRVAEYAIRIGEEFGLDPIQVDLLKKSALLHDIGKVGIPDMVLLKEGRLTEEEFAEIQKHPGVGAKIIEQSNMDEELLKLVPGIKYHHERYDGFGYPDGLAGEEIPLFGRIIAVADAFDAMTSNRTYRSGMTAEKALHILQDGSGSQWDPNIVDCFIRLQRKELEQHDPNKLAE